jgi:branched-chain amino acid transport system ATP-binding protein
MAHGRDARADGGLVVDRIYCRYGEAPALRGVSLCVPPGQVVGLLGRNGAGKTTTLNAIMGLVRLQSGRITLDGRALDPLPAHEIPRLGITYVPQGRRLFPSLSVLENLQMGLLVTGRGQATLQWIFELFPVLGARLGQRAGTLSGGEQQMLAVARALCAEPGYLLMDEPSEGLMPAMTQTLLQTIRAVKARRVGVLLVEQKVDVALDVADTVVLLEHGEVRHRAAPADLIGDPAVLTRYLGVRR